MKEELLKIIRDESKKEIINLKSYNAYVRFRNKLAIEEGAKELLGLPHNRNLELVEKKESDVIMHVYKKYLSYIEEKDTNGIYVYMGSYMPTDTSDYVSYVDATDEAPFEMEVDINDPRATHRRYWNLEGVWAKSIAIEDCDEFERTHTVIYVNNFYGLQREFIMMAVNESQEVAVSKILKRYKRQ